jgi:hypothetical protein
LFGSVHHRGGRRPGGAARVEEAAVLVAYGDPATTPLSGTEVRPGKQTLDFDLRAKGE